MNIEGDLTRLKVLLSISGKILNRYEFAEYRKILHETLDALRTDVDANLKIMEENRFGTTKKKK